MTVCFSDFDSTDCGVSVECLEVIEERDLNDIFKDERAIGQRILLRHRLREWRKGLHWVSDGRGRSFNLRWLNSTIIILNYGFFFKSFS